jgi:hypothetical protein
MGLCQETDSERRLHPTNEEVIGIRDIKKLLV